ncbi:hypothetical protein FISHEDRAFT_74943 [Fistulina hepatica ATCC 64428]|uniref:Uncharacterized protein n=1 Tax=Fistulina hepatica ATCC 64428 TaxID=1128425 RepID=A0A0D7AB41_9AGAR|nr:hypothetical protein FISHEDRAFT_74943 [Fistulina hepatica ATCC 64428]
MLALQTTAHHADFLTLKMCIFGVTATGSPVKTSDCGSKDCLSSILYMPSAPKKPSSTGQGKGQGGRSK